MTFQAKLSAVYAEVESWRRPSEDGLRQLGSSLSASEVTEALERIEELARERERIRLDPDLNCDDEDEVHFAQRDIANALQYLDPEATDALVEGLRSPCRSVRFWSSIALQHAACPRHRESIRKAHAVETDAMVGEALEDALQQIGSVQ